MIACGLSSSRWPMTDCWRGFAEHAYITLCLEETSKSSEEAGAIELVGNSSETR